MSFKIKFVAFDFEWGPEGIYCAAFADSNGNRIAMHVSEMGSEKNLIQKINEILSFYPTSYAYYSTGPDSDLDILYERSIKNFILPIVVKKTNGKGYPRIKEREHIDLYRIFEKQMIKTLYDNKYKSLKLDDVARALLGRGKKGSAKDAHTYTVAEVKEYCLTDAGLVLDLVKLDNYRVMGLMQAMAGLVNMQLATVCHYGLSAVWRHVINSITPPPALPPKFVKEPFNGGLVFDPVPGEYKNVKVVDVTSLYPTIIITKNISFDTVNCKCCSDDPLAKVPPQVLPGYWLCRKKTGALPYKLQQFTQERLMQKKLGNDAAALVLKILINSGYGVFAYKNFTYAHMGVAKLIPAFGRSIIKDMRILAGQHSFTVIGGDTDSLFLTGDGDMQEFIGACKKIGVDVEHEKTFRKMIITGKKHYFGHAYNIKKNRFEAVVKGMEGKKDDRPKWIHDAFEQFIDDYCHDRDPAVNLKTSLQKFYQNRVPLPYLQYRVKINKDAQDYETNTMNRYLAMQAGAQARDVISYYKVKNKPGYSVFLPNADQIDRGAYLQSFSNTFGDALEILKIDLDYLLTGQKQLRLDGF